MDDLLEIVFEIIFGIFDHKFEKEKSHYVEYNIDSIKETPSHEAYIAGLIASAMVICYSDDQKLDKEEKKMIHHLIKSHHYELTKRTKKTLKQIRNQKISIGSLKFICTKLNIDNEMFTKIIDDLERILKYSEEDNNKKLFLIEELRNN